MMKDLAKHILALVEEKNQENLSVLALQKVLYFSLGEYIRNHGVDSYLASIYTSPFEAWDYGPVNRDIYREHRYGALLPKRNDQAFGVLNDYILKNASRNPFEMVDDSHKRPFWDGNKEDILSRTKLHEYNIEDLKNDFV